MLVSSFQIQLREQLEAGKVCYGRFDGERPTLAAVTTGGRILLHCPHASDSADSGTTFLQVKKDIQAIAAGCLTPDGKRDLLFIGSGRDLQAYDVQQNADVFYRDIPDGVGSLLVGAAPSDSPASTGPLIYVGGNLSITGLDASGREQFWTVSNEFVSALAFCDATGEGQRNLLAGALSCDIHVFQDEAMVEELPEADGVVALCGVTPGCFGYALANGTVGMYRNMQRAWRVKSKSSVNTICSYDLDGDGVPELISGWSNGKLEVRSPVTGKVLFRDQLSAGIADISVVDFRNDGTEQLVVCALDGEVRGYTAIDKTTHSVAHDARDAGARELLLTELHQKRKQLKQELHLLKENAADSDDDSQRGSFRGIAQDVVPLDTTVTAKMAVNKAAGRMELVVSTTAGTVIKGVIIFAEHLWEGESHFVPAPTPAATLAVPIHPSKDVLVEMLVKVLVGSATSKVFHVFEADAVLPRFGMYTMWHSADSPSPRGRVSFTLPERLERLMLWAQELFQCKLDPGGDKGSTTAAFVSLRDGAPLVLALTPGGEGTVVEIGANSMSVAGDVFQEVMAAVRVADVASVVDFADEAADVQGLMDAVAECKSGVAQMAADVADMANLVKTLVVKAEDARLLSNMGMMRRKYRALRDLNGDMVNEHEKRAMKQAKLLASLKEVNRFVQLAARLRHGEPKTSFIAACRKAIQQNNIDGFLKLFRDGK